MRYGLGIGLGLGLGSERVGSRMQPSGGMSVAEDAANGTTVGTISAVGTTGTPTWSEVADPSGLFTINSSTGVITTTGALDYETATSHSYTVGVSGVTPAISNTTFTITVTDVAEGGGTAGEPIGLLLTLTKAA